MIRIHVVLILTTLLIALSLGVDHSRQGVGTFQLTISLHSNAWAQDGEDAADIQWFKETMKISPRYQEQGHGLLGMSYTHFFVMVFLILFFIGTFLNSYLRSKRTRDALQTLLKEENNHGS
jgi:disulfide bond formation protein DsbB